MRDQFQESPTNAVVDECWRAAQECQTYSANYMNYVQIGDIRGMWRSQRLAAGAAVRMAAHLRALEEYFPQTLLEAAE